MHRFPFATFSQMELLLNLLWLLLVMPAFWLWRYSRTAPERRAASPLHCLLALACLLVILFPVISATDDLHAMRAEMEESPSSKRSIGQSSGDPQSFVLPALPPALFSPSCPGVAPFRKPTRFLFTHFLYRKRDSGLPLISWGGKSIGTIRGPMIPTRPWGVGCD